MTRSEVMCLPIGAVFTDFIIMVFFKEIIIFLFIIRVRVIVVFVFVMKHVSAYAAGIVIVNYGIAVWTYYCVF